VYWRPIGSRKWPFQRTHYRTPKIEDGWDPHLENRHDVIFFAEGGPIWIKFRRLVQNNMSIAVIWSKSKPDVEFQYGGHSGEFNGMSSQSHYHIAGCCHLVNSLSWFKSHMPHCRVQSPGEINVMTPATLQGVIPSAILKIVFAIFYFIWFFKCRLWRAAASYRLRYTCLVNIVTNQTKWWYCVRYIRILLFMFSTR